MLKELIRLADHLDKKGFVKEASYLDKIIKKIAAVKMQCTSCGWNGETHKGDDICPECGEYSLEPKMKEGSGDDLFDQKEYETTVPGEIRIDEDTELGEGADEETCACGELMYDGKCSDPNCDLGLMPEDEIDLLDEDNVVPFEGKPQAALPEEKPKLMMGSLKSLVRLANHLDKKGFTKEATYLDKTIKKYVSKK